MKDLINKIHGKFSYEYLGGQLLINGDCLEVMELINDKSVDLIFTDPPYKQEFHGRGILNKRKNYNKIANYGSNIELIYDDFFKLCLQKLRQVNFFTFCDKETKYDFITLAKQFNYGYKELCFCKTSPTPFCNNQWLPDVEFGLHIFSNIKVYGDYTTKRSWSILNNFKEKNIDHPTPKIVSEVERIINNISKINDIILDSFSGSGTTTIACIRTNRQSICIEKDEEYYKLGVNRVKEELRQGDMFRNNV